jgi:hypothetical protein
MSTKTIDGFAQILLCAKSRSDMTEVEIQQLGALLDNPVDALTWAMANGWTEDDDDPLLNWLWDHGYPFPEIKH